MPWKIAKRESKYCVVKEDGTGTTVACHDTEAEATAQLRALYASEKRASSIKALDVPGDEESEDGLLVFGWESAKALDGDGEFVGYLWRWGSPQLPDATKFKDYFTPATGFGRYVNGEIEGYLHHALPVIKGRPNPAGDTSIGVGRVTQDGEGGWLKARLDLSVPGAAETWDALKSDDNAFGLSSGAISHLVRRERQPSGAHWLKKWPLVEWSITPDPAERRTAAVAVKSIESAFADAGPSSPSHETIVPGGAVAAPSLADLSRRLVADRREFVALVTKMRDQRRAEGRDLSIDKYEAIKAELSEHRGVVAALEELEKASAPRKASPRPELLARASALTGKTFEIR